MKRCYLDPSNIFAEHGLDQLRLWLAGYDSRQDMFSNPPPALSDLHSALMCAVMELKNRLDPQLEYVVNTAAEQQYGMEFDPDAFWTERVFDLDGVDRMRRTGIKTLDRGRTMRYLAEARDEIDWTRNEIRRFEVHLDNAQKLIAQKLRKKFAYRITPRKRVQYSLVPYVKGDAVQAKEDEEMLDDEHAAERRARSRSPEPGELSRYDDDFEFSDGQLRGDEKEGGEKDGGEKDGGEKDGGEEEEKEGEDMEGEKENVGGEKESPLNDDEAKEDKSIEEKARADGAGDRKDSVLATLSWGYLRI